MMITVRINPAIAKWYGWETDIDWMPQTSGKHEVTLETLDSWIACMKSDLDREDGQAYSSEDKNYSLIAALKRQLVSLNKAKHEFTKAGA